MIGTIGEVLAVAPKYGNDMFGDDWIFQKDDVNPHVHAKSQEWCVNSFLSFIDKDHWPPNSCDLNPLDYCIRTEIVQAITWNTVISKKILLVAFKRAIKETSKDVLFESCSS